MKKLLSIGILIMMILLAGCSSAGSYHKNGKQSFEKGDYEAAADYFSKAITENPNRGEYYIDYGLALTALGDYEAALKQFEQAYVNKDMFIIRENNKRAFRGKGIVYYNMQNYEAALKEFQKALEIDVLEELNVDVLYYMGSSYNLMGDYQSAVRTYTTLLDKEKDGQAYACRALSYRYLGIYDKSLEDYDNAIQTDPNQFDYYFGKYNLLMDQGKDAEAIAVLAQAADIKVKTELDQYNLAKLHYYQENYDTALTELENSYTAGYNEAYYYMGEIYRLDKDYSKAIYYYENYINKGNVSSSKVYNQIAVCHMKLGEYGKALEYLETGLGYHDAGTMKTMLKNEIIAYENLSDFKTAQDKLKEYLERYPEDEAAIRETEFIDTRLMDAVLN